MKRYFIVLSAFAVCLLLAMAALPQAGLARNPVLDGFSETEKTGFAFYYLSGHTPPFDDWIKTGDVYKNARPRQQMIMLDEQRIRLRDGFLNYTPDSGPITLRLRTRITGGPNPDYIASPDDDQHHDAALGTAALTHQITIDFLDFDRASYLPVQTGYLWVGVIPDRLENLVTHNITEASFFSLADILKHKGGEVMMDIILRPISADAQIPVMNGDIPVWPMIADIAGLTLTDDSGLLRWEYAADWYDYDRASSLMTLYSK